MSKTKSKNRNTLLNDLHQGHIAPIYLFYGEEDYLLKEFTEQVKKAALEQGAEDFNFDVYYASDVEGAVVVNAAMSVPMMTERRVVLVKNIQHFKSRSIDLLAAYSERPSPSTCLILVSEKFKSDTPSAKKLKKNSYHIEAKRLYDNQIPGWIKTYLKNQKFSITDGALQLLQVNTGNSLRTICSELDKIKLNLGDRTEITVQDVETVVGISREYNVFEFCDAVVERQIKKSIRIQARMLQLGESPIGLLVMLTRHFTILAKLNTMLRQRQTKPDISKRLKINPYFVDNYIRQARLYSQTQIMRAFELLLEADQQLKMSYQKPGLILENLIFKLSLLS